MVATVAIYRLIILIVITMFIMIKIIINKIIIGKKLKTKTMIPRKCNKKNIAYNFS